MWINRLSLQWPRGFPATLPVGEGFTLKRALNPAAPHVIETLRAATRSRHERLEASRGMARLFDPAYSLTEYRAHLGRLLGIVEPLEQLAACTAEVSAGLALPPLRSCALREDLSAMGHTAAEIAALDRCGHLPEIAPAGLRGYTYVMLGSMLGGQVIVKQLRAALGPGASLLFYGGTSDSFKPLWSAFRLDLEEHGKDDVDEICATAARIFDAYFAWLSEPLPSRGGP